MGQNLQTHTNSLRIIVFILNESPVDHIHCSVPAYLTIYKTWIVQVRLCKSEDTADAFGEVLFKITTVRAVGLQYDSDYQTKSRKYKPNKPPSGGPKHVIHN